MCSSNAAVKSSVKSAAEKCAAGSNQLEELLVVSKQTVVCFCLSKSLKEGSRTIVVALCYLLI